MYCRGRAFYPGLSSLIEGVDGELRRLRVCIVTPDIVGPVKNGGIGTACSSLAFALAQAGHEIQVLFTRADAGRPETWLDEYSSRGIKVYCPFAESMERRPVFPDNAQLAVSMGVYEWLAARQDFDLILFMDWQGNGFYPLHAKKCGLNFQNTALVVIIHSPAIWHAMNNAAPPASPLDAITWHMERQCIEMADAVISPSSYMLDWCATHGFRLPGAAFAQPNILQSVPRRQGNGAEPIEELVFFGRLEYRKGLEQFCKAMDILAQKGRLPKKVTFLGKCAWVGNEHCLLHIAEHSRNWQGSELSLLLHYDRRQALEYLLEPGRLAVMPSVADNSPYTVYECLAAGIPFIAADVGGTAELVSRKDRQTVLCDDNPHHLADMLSERLGKKPCLAKAAFDGAENVRAWTAGLASLSEIAGSRREECRVAERPFISVCLTHYERPEMLRMAVKSLLEQNYRHFEVILADDGSQSPAARECLHELEPVFRQRGWRILRLDNGYVGKARNIAAAHARGAWLLFFDDDNVAMPDMLSTFATAASSRRGCSLFVSSFDVYESDGEPGDECRAERFLPCGAIASYSVIHNVIGDATSLIRREAFERLGGFRCDYGLGNEDFELFLRLVLAGEDVGIVPRSLFRYRRSSCKTSVNRDTNGAANRMRSLRPYMEFCSPWQAEAALLAHGLAGEAGSYGENDGDGSFSRLQDPQSAPVLNQLLNALIAHGQPDMAMNIALSLNESGPEPARGFNRQRREILQMAMREDIPALERGIKAFEWLLSTLPEKERITHMSGLFGLLLQWLPKKDSTLRLRRQLADTLMDLKTTDIDINLLLAMEKAQKDPEKAVISLMRGLAAAESEYLQKRHDVAAAVARGDFVCGLHHFALFGQVEGEVWPHYATFCRALEQMKKSADMVSQAHLFTYKYQNKKLAARLLAAISQ